MHPEGVNRAQWMVCPEEGKQRAVGQVVSSCNRKHCGACSVPPKLDVNVQM